MADEAPIVRALVLQGGGALGAFALGAARVLYAERGWRPDVISGVSIGAIRCANGGRGTERLVPASSAHTKNTTGSTSRRCKERAMDIRPIRTKADYRAALKEVERLWDAEPGTPDGDRVDVLVTLIEAYEATHYPIPAPDPIAAVEFMMEQKGLTRRDLERAIGRRGRVSEVLNRKRPLTLPMVRELSALLQIPAEVLIQPYHTRSAA